MSGHSPGARIADNKPVVLKLEKTKPTISARVDAHPTNRSVMALMPVPRFPLRSTPQTKQVTQQYVPASSQSAFQCVMAATTIFPRKTLANRCKKALHLQGSQYLTLPETAYLVPKILSPASPRPGTI